MLQLWSIVYARMSFVGSCVVDLERSHPDVVEEMLTSSFEMVPIDADGMCRSRSGRLQWAPRVSAVQLTEVFAYAVYGMGTAAAVSIAAADSILTWSQPYCAEMPAAMLELIKAEPSDELGQSYRRYVQKALLPGLRLVGEIMRQHGSTIGAACFSIAHAALYLTKVRANRTSKSHWYVEWPPLTWLEEKHPNRSKTEPADSHAHHWLVYMRASEVLLAAWDDGVFVDMVPGRPLPLSGMMECVE
eukprot:SAG31_NODE_9056_length_1342_cov_1.196299_2_plen_245_part_00